MAKLIYGWQTINIKSYRQSNLRISTICYLRYKDLNETKAPFSHCCVEQKCLKTFLPDTIYKRNKLQSFRKCLRLTLVFV